MSKNQGTDLETLRFELINSVLKLKLTHLGDVDLIVDTINKTLDKLVK